MYLIHYDNIEGSSARVLSIHYSMVGLSDDFIQRGVMVAQLPPEPIPPIGHVPQLRIDLDTSSLFYAFTKEPMTTEEKLAVAEERIADLEAATAAILGGQGGGF